MATAFHHYNPLGRGIVHFVLSNLFCSQPKTEEELRDVASGTKIAEVAKEAMVNSDSTRVQQPDVTGFVCEGQGKNTYA